MSKSEMCRRVGNIEREEGEKRGKRATVISNLYT